eukprot:3166687-Rhodomonas_salina.2
MPIVLCNTSIGLAYSATPRNQIQETASLVQLVLKSRFLGMTFGVYGLAVCSTEIADAAIVLWLGYAVCGTEIAYAAMRCAAVGGVAMWIAVSEVHTLSATIYATLSATLFTTLPTTLSATLLSTLLPTLSAYAVCDAICYTIRPRYLLRYLTTQYATIPAALPATAVLYGATCYAVSGTAVLYAYAPAMPSSVLRYSTVLYCATAGRCDGRGRTTGGRYLLGRAATKGRARY